MLSPPERRRHEAAATAGAFLLFFLLFTSYFMLRPVRDTFGIAGGVKNLEWLFTATFVATLCVVPLYGWLSKKLPRSLLVPTTYLFSGTVLTGFAVGLLVDPGNVWGARAFFVWLAVMNLFVISIAWSLMADIFNADQAHRLFGRIAAGASVGGLTGPLLSRFLVDTIGHAGLLLLSTGLLLSTLICVRYLLGWRARYGDPSDPRPATQPLGGSIWAGITTIVRSPYLLAISLFVVLLTATGTFLYFEQARLVAEQVPDPVQQTQLFGTVDAIVQALTLITQLFITGPVARRLGVSALLVSVPIVMLLAFIVLAAAPALGVLLTVMVLRRLGEYALIRPGQEMVFTTFDTETKYKAKNAIDTVVYRGGDMLSAWANSAIVAIGSSMIAALVGAGLSAIWAASGYFIGKRHDRVAGKKTTPAPTTA